MRGPPASVLPALLAALALVAPRAGAEGENRAWPLDLTLRGPLEEVVLDFAAEGVTRIEVPLLAGEELHLTVPVPVRSPLGADGLARIALPVPAIVGGGRVGVLGWNPEARGDTYERLPPGLRARPRPPVPDGAPRAGWAALALLAMAFVVGLAARRTRVVGPLVGLAVGGVVLFLTLTTRPVLVTVRVLEGDVAGGAWLEVRAGLDALDGFVGRLERTPEAGPVRFEVRVEGARARVSVEAPGALLHEVRVRPAAADPGPDLFGYGPPEVTWRRQPGGDWIPGGAWRGGAPPPPPLVLPTGEEPPGWLKAGLPPGVEVLLGRFGGPGSTSWLRVTDPF